MTTCRDCGCQLFYGAEMDNGICRVCIRRQVDKWNCIWWGPWPWNIPFHVFKGVSN